MEEKEKKNKSDDWVDVYFSIQKELGLDIGFRFGHCTRDQPTTWQALSHDQFDGVGGFAHILRKDGWPVKTLPKSRESGPPSRLSMVLPMIRYVIGKRKVTEVKWKEEHEENKIGTIDAFSKGLTLGETKRVLTKAKASGVTVNTLLLESINKIVNSHLQQQEKANIWVVPVNIRGAINRANDTSNHVSFFPVSIEHGQSLSEIQTESKKNLDKKSQWVTWHFLNLTGKKKGRDGIFEMVKSTIDEHLGVTGVFSNLGSWPHSDDLGSMSEYSKKISDDKTWFFGPNITAAVPVGAGALTWFGKLGLTVQVHPYITKDQSIAQEILDEWHSDLLE